MEVPWSTSAVFVGFFAKAPIGRRGPGQCRLVICDRRPLRIRPTQLSSCGRFLVQPGDLWRGPHCQEPNEMITGLEPALGPSLFCGCWGGCDWSGLQGEASGWAGCWVWQKNWGTWQHSDHSEWDWEHSQAAPAFEWGLLPGPVHFYPSSVLPGALRARAALHPRRVDRFEWCLWSSKCQVNCLALVEAFQLAGKLEDRATTATNMFHLNSCRTTSVSIMAVFAVLLWQVTNTTP